MLIDRPVGGRSRDAGALRLDWYAAAGWTLTGPDEPLPMVVFDEPCIMRRLALDAVTEIGRQPDLVCEAADLAGVLVAARSGLGVTLLPSAKPRLEGLVVRDDLPQLEPAPLCVRARPGLADDLANLAAQTVREVLEAHS